MTEQQRAFNLNCRRKHSWPTLGYCIKRFLVKPRKITKDLNRHGRCHCRDSNPPNTSYNLYCWNWLAIPGADKSLARPRRKQARKHVRDARDFNNIETRAVIKFFSFLQGKAPKEINKIITITIIFINCNWVVTRWQWLFYMYTEYEIVY